MGSPCDIHRLNIYCSGFSSSTWKLFCLNGLKKKPPTTTDARLCVSVALHMRPCLFARKQLVYPATRTTTACSHLSLRVQGCCAITKTALSITLTDRLKRGFNSYSSPRALHHRGRHPSTPRPPSLSRLLSLDPVNHPRRPRQKWPPMLPRIPPPPHSPIPVIRQVPVQRGTAVAGERALS